MLRTAITHIDTACCILDIHGFRILTDPVFDHPGTLYHFGFGSVSRKKDRPAMRADQIGRIDLVLLSHHQHADNLDRRGREVMYSIDHVLSTEAAARALSDHRCITGLQNWQTVSVPTDRVPGLRVTAVPAQHHPSWLPEFFSGKVIGFVIEYDGQEDGAIYISGDTVYFTGIEEIACRFRIGTAILHVGGVRFPYLTGPGRYTFNAGEAIRCAVEVNAKRVIPVHYRGWTHFREDQHALRTAFGESAIADRLLWLQSGEETVIL